MSEHTAEKDPPWSCPDCPWVHRPHPVYGWAAHDTRAIEVHRTMLCPAVEKDVCPHHRLALIYAEPNGRWECEACREVLALRPVFAVPAELRLGSCCVNVGTDACACENPTRWGTVIPPVEGSGDV